MTFTCEKCGEEIMTAAKTIQNVHEEDCDISYCVCQHCGAKNLICVFDEKMHELVKERVHIEELIRIARIKHFRPDTINKYLAQHKKVADDLKFHADLLKPIGLRYLKKIEEGEGENGEEEHNSAEP